jgi:hypothetical protein
MWYHCGAHYMVLLGTTVKGGICEKNESLGKPSAG